MRVLGVGDTNDLGSLYLHLAGCGHEVRVFIAEPEARDTLGGMLTLTSDWRGDLDWVRSAGRDGLVIFETATHGALQDELRTAGFAVVGGSAYGDRLEGDRPFGQAVMRAAGMRVAPSWTFDAFETAMAFVRARPGRYVHKLSGSGFSTGRTFVSEMLDGRDMLAYLEFQRTRWPATEPLALILMVRVIGVEVGVGGYFDGQTFLEPTCIDWEHKRFFPGDVGELTGEMGTVVSYRGGERLFSETLGRMVEQLREGGYCGYININTIVNGEGVWPLEFTCRFGYPGFAVLQALHRCGWEHILRLTATHEGDEVGAPRPGVFPTDDGYAVGVVLTVPPFPYSLGYQALSKGLPVLLDSDVTAADRAHMHLSEVALESSGGWVTSGLVGYTMVVTGVGEDVETARRDAYARVAKVHIPTMRYRNDIGATFSDCAARLRRWGWLE